MENLILTNEELVRNEWLSKYIKRIKDQYLDKKKREYQELYPDTIVYAVYLFKDESDPFNITYVWSDEMYDDVDENIIKAEYQEAIELGNIKPTLDKYLDDAEVSFIIDISEINYTPYVGYSKNLLISTINNLLDNRLKKIAIKYPEREQSTWDKQEREALAYNADTTVLTPFIDGIVMIRGIDKDILVSKILEKAVGFATISGIAVGYRQKAEDLISTIDSLETLKNVIDTINNDNKAFNELMSQ